MRNQDTGGNWKCVSISCYDGWPMTSYPASATVDSAIAPYIKKPDDPVGGRGYGGYMYNSAWSATGYPIGAYLTWILEPGAADCGPGVIYGSTATYIQCIAKID